MQQPEKQPMSSGEIVTLANEWLQLAVTYLNLAGKRRKGWRISQINEMNDIQKTLESDDKIYRNREILAIKNG